MLFITIPTGEREGTCRINGEVVEFRIEGGRFDYRPKGGGGPWTRRVVRRAMPVAPGLTAYAASEADDDSYPLMFTV